MHGNEWCRPVGKQCGKVHSQLMDPGLCVIVCISDGDVVTVDAHMTYWLNVWEAHEDGCQLDIEIVLHSKRYYRAVDKAAATAHEHHHKKEAVLTETNTSTGKARGTERAAL